MGAAMVDDPAVVLFAGGIGMEGTVVDSNVDAFAVPAAAGGERRVEGTQQPADSTSSTEGQRGQGDDDMLVDQEVLS